VASDRTPDDARPGEHIEPPTPAWLEATAAPPLVHLDVVSDVCSSIVEVSSVEL
jgi:hypothetical protein